LAHSVISKKVTTTPVRARIRICRHRTQQQQQSYLELFELVYWFYVVVGNSTHQTTANQGQFFAHLPPSCCCCCCCCHHLSQSCSTTLPGPSFCAARWLLPYGCCHLPPSCCCCCCHQLSPSCITSLPDPSFCAAGVAPARLLLRSRWWAGR
jgi:hypothetical protein